jgi:hypothetical protein
MYVKAQTSQQVTKATIPHLQIRTCKHTGTQAHAHTHTQITPHSLTHAHPQSHPHSHTHTHARADIHTSPFLFCQFLFLLHFNLLCWHFDGLLPPLLSFKSAVSPFSCTVYMHMAHLFACETSLLTHDPQCN